MSLLPLLFATWWTNPGNIGPLTDYDAYNVYPKPMAMMRRPFFRSVDPFNFDNVFDDFDGKFKMFDHSFDRPFRKFDMMPNWMTKGLANAKITNDGKTYQVVINVSKFKPEEVEVNVKGRSLVVKAERDTNGYISMVQSYSMPYNVDISKMDTRIEKGVLTIKIPLKAPESKKVHIDVPTTEKTKGEEEKVEEKESEKDKQEKKPEGKKEEKKDEKEKKKEEEKKKETEEKQEEKKDGKKEPEQKKEEAGKVEKKEETKKEEKKESEKQETSTEKKPLK